MDYKNDIEGLEVCKTLLCCKCEYSKECMVVPTEDCVTKDTMNNAITAMKAIADAKAELPEKRDCQHYKFTSICATCHRNSFIDEITPIVAKLKLELDEAREKGDNDN